MVDAFTPRECTTGENTGDTLSGIEAVETGSILTGFVWSTSPPPFGEAAKLPAAPPSIGSYASSPGVFNEDTASVLGNCDDSPEQSEEEEQECGTLAWDVTEQDPEEEGVIINMVTRVMYQTEEDGGSEILYGFCRTLGFDTAGKLAAISGECRYIIDTPEPCIPDEEE